METAAGAGRSHRTAPCSLARLAKEVGRSFPGRAGTAAASAPRRGRRDPAGERRTGARRCPGRLRVGCPGNQRRGRGARVRRRGGAGRAVKRSLGAVGPGGRLRGSRCRGELDPSQTALRTAALARRGADWANGFSPEACAWWRWLSPAVPRIFSNESDGRLKASVPHTRTALWGRRSRAGRGHCGEDGVSARAAPAAVPASLLQAAGLAWLPPQAFLILTSLFSNSICFNL